VAGAVRDLTGQVVIVTGASSGIGLAAATAFAARGAGVVLVGRTKERLTAAVEQVAAAGGPRPLYYEADFSRLDDVHLLGDQLRQRLRRVNVLVNNAGLAVLRKHTTVDGHELTIQVNHLAGFLLAHLIRDQLRGGRLLVTASDAHRTHGIDPADLSANSGWNAYGASKSANILFAIEANRRWPDVRAASFHPGVVRTRLGAGTAMSPFFRWNPLLTTPEKAVDTMTWLASAPANEIQPGGYYVKRKLKTPAAHAADPQTAARLWDASMVATGLSWSQP
jgi:NAD(P)-dependent dehydrogenase (short-subunit alcohol dehydrogenase family)